MVIAKRLTRNFSIEKLGLLLGVILLIITFFSINSSAYFMGFGHVELGENIFGQVESVNEMIRVGLELMTNPGMSPIAIVNSKPELVNAVTAVQTVSLALCALFFFIDFFKKSVDFQWASKWENIIMLLIKIFLAKVFVENSLLFAELIFNIFNEFGTYLGNQNYNMFSAEIDPQETQKGMKAMEMLLTPPDLLYIKQSFNTGEGALRWANPLEGRTLLIYLSVQPTLLILFITGIVTFVTAIGRAFELAILTVAAPLPLSTFSGSETHDIGKAFVKKYVSVILQFFIIILMFSVYEHLSNTFTPNVGMNLVNIITLLPMSKFLLALALGVGIFKSGATAKSLVGAV